MPTFQMGSNLGWLPIAEGVTVVAHAMFHAPGGWGRRIMRLVGASLDSIMRPCFRKRAVEGEKKRKRKKKE